MVHSSTRPVVYEPYHPSDATDVARLFGEAFTTLDPPHVAVGLTAAEFEYFVHVFLPRSDTELLTMVARSAESGQLAGVMFNDDLASTTPDGYVQVSAKFEPIDDMLSQLGTEYLGNRDPLPGELLHLFLLGVAPRFAGQGVAQRLVNESLKLGRRYGYKTAVTEATNPTSQHIFSKLGFTSRVYRSYRDYRLRSRAVFASIADQGGMSLMDRTLGDLTSLADSQELVKGQGT